MIPARARRLGLVFAATALAALAVLEVVFTAATPSTLSAMTITDGSPAPAAGSTAEDPAVRAAWSWILTQRGSGTVVTSASTIRAARDYPADWTGPVSGSFTPNGISSPVTAGSSIVVDEPATVPDDGAGSVSGHVTLPPAAGRWIVQVYRDTDAGRVQVPLQTLVAPDGTFTVDLSAVSDPPPGHWALGLLDAERAYAPAGTAWPGDTYTDWEVRAYVVTDTAYLLGSQPAATDGRFSFASSRPGTKVFQLVDTRTGAVLAEDAPDFGLLRSFGSGSRAYAYDQAVAVVAALATGHDAAPLTAGLLTLQNADGGFNESADVRNPAAATAVQRAGITAVATYALLRELQAVPPADPTRPALAAAARGALTWLLDLRTSQGLIAAGRGDYAPDGALDPAAVPAWVSTEHNVDAWQTLELAGRVLADPAYTAAAGDLADAIVSRLWDPAAGRFDQGLDPAGVQDRTDPLDVSSWGSLFLLAAGHPDLAQQAFAHTAAFASPVTVAGGPGYRAYYPQPAFPDAPPDVWTEGTAGVAVAAQRFGQASQAASLLDELRSLQRPDGALPYAAVADRATSMTTDSSVGGTGWFLLAAAGAGSIWDEPTP